MMSKLHPIARVMIAVLKDPADDLQAAGDRRVGDARVPPEAVKAFWRKIRRRAC